MRCNTQYRKTFAMNVTLALVVSGQLCSADPPQEILPALTLTAIEPKKDSDGTRLVSHSSRGEDTEPLLMDDGATALNQYEPYRTDNSKTTCAEECGSLCTEQCSPMCADECEAHCDSSDRPLCTDECSMPCEEKHVCHSCTPCASRWYLSVSGAGQRRETVHEVADERTFIKFHNGFLANAALGVRFDGFRFELESSFMNNEVDLAGAAGFSTPSPGNVNIRAYMFNVYHDVQMKGCCWKPYVGAGIGTYQSEINGLIPEFFDQIGPPFAGTPVNATSDMPLAYQFRAGVTRPIGRRAEFYSGYRYFRGEDLEFASAPFATFAPTFNPDGARIHAIETGVRVNF